MTKLVDRSEIRKAAPFLLTSAEPVVE